MDRTRFLLGLSLVAALVLVLAGAPRPAPAESESWKDIAKEFKKIFKPSKTSLAKREAVAKTVSRAADGRGVPLLLGALRDMDKHIGKLHDAWSEGQQAWTEKTARMERQREERIRKIVEKARKEGKEPRISINLQSEEGRWLGAPPKHIGEMEKVRKQLMDQYDRIVAERELLERMRRGVARILREVEGDEFETATSALLKAVARTKDEERAAMIKMLGYVRGDAVTRHLVGETRDRDPAHVQAALASLGRQNSEEGKRVLLAFLENEAWQLRSAALDGLVFYRDVGVVEALIARAAKEEGVVRRRIFQALSSITGERVKAVLEAWQSWWPTNKQDVIDSWKRLPREAPVREDPPKLPLETPGTDGGTSFYGIKTDSKHIIFVADVSGSMRRTDDTPKDDPAKIDVCRDELKRAIRSLSATDEDDRGAATFNVVLFSTEVMIYKPGKMVVATKKNKEKAFKWIDEHVQPDMQTNIFDALVGAFNIISGSSDKKNRQRGADTIFLMTDGAPNRGKFVRPQIILQEVRKLNEVRDITIHAIGVGKGHNAGFLQQLATQNGGQYLARGD